MGNFVDGNRFLKKDPSKKNAPKKKPVKRRGPRVRGNLIF